MFLKDVPFFWVLLAAHLIGDYYLQSQKMSTDKQEKFSVLINHCIIYGGCVLVVAWGLCGAMAIPGISVVCFGHFGVDTLKFFLLKLFPNSRKGLVLMIDQTIHLATITAVVLWWPTDIRPCIPELMTALDWSCRLSTFLRLSCLALFIGKPANIILKVSNQKPAADNAAQSEDRRFGAIIGTLERILTAVLFLLGQYGAISIVFTAKTLTRYKKITDSPEFGEYYLIGTLGSLLLAILPAILLFPPNIVK